MGLVIFSGALILGGITTSLILWSVGGLLRSISTLWLAAFVTAFGVAVSLRDLRILRFPLPQNSRQVPREVFYGGLTRAAARFGFELGTGVRTYVSAGAPYVLALSVSLLAQKPVDAVTVGTGFGLGRAAMTLFRHLSRSGDAWDERLDETLKWLVPTISILVIGSIWLLVA